MWVIVIVLLIVTILAMEWIRKVRQYPPGPFPLPLIGNIHNIMLAKLQMKGIIDLMKVWQKEYGNVITIWLGPIPSVHLLDFETAKQEMLSNGAAYTDRFVPYMLDVRREGRGTAFSNGEFWADHRRFTLRTLRDFALKNSVMEERIMDEVTSNLYKLEKIMVNGQAKVKANEFFDVIVGSVINRILFSESFTEENMAEYFAVKHRFDDMINNSTALDMSLEKWTRNMPFLKKRWEALIKPQDDLLNFLRKRINQRKEDIASGKHALDENGKDFVDAFFIKMEKDRREGKHPSQSYKEDELLYDIFDLWIAGQETTTITLMWGMMHLIKNPDVMDKIRSELIAITNSNRSISLSDQDQAQYLNWTILEIHRLASILNLNLFRKTKEKGFVGGHHVPADTPIAAELTMIMNDEKHFQEANKFDPERYARGGKALEQRVIPFGLGKRSCIGETLAKAELFLILANLISRYDMAEDPEAPIDLKTSSPIGMMHRPKNFNIILKPTL
ncbi:hypothetical protein V3C99_002185 [Haemonchus contortus]